MLHCVFSPSCFHFTATLCIAMKRPFFHTCRTFPKIAPFGWTASSLKPEQRPKEDISCENFSLLIQQNTIDPRIRKVNSWDHSSPSNKKQKKGTSFLPGNPFGFGNFRYPLNWRNRRILYLSLYNRSVDSAATVQSFSEGCGDLFMENGIVWFNFHGIKLKRIFCYLSASQTVSGCRSTRTKTFTCTNGQIRGSHKWTGIQLKSGSYVRFTKLMNGDN